MNTYKVALLKGDGIGPEIVDSAVRVLEAVGKKRGIGFAILLLIANCYLLFANSYFAKLIIAMEFLNFEFCILFFQLS